jgi:Tfp pilus assembly protein FimT
MRIGEMIVGALASRDGVLQQRKPVPYEQDSMKNRRKRLTSRTGFSLVDIVASVAVIATVSALSVPQVIDVVDSMKLGMSIRDVERELQFARLKAVASNRPMRVRFDCPSAGKVRVVEVLGTSALPDANDADSVLNRCSETAYPYSPTGAGKSRLTRPDNDGPIRTLQAGATFTATQTLEFWPNGTVHTACQAACETSTTRITTVTLTLSRKKKTKTITVNGIGKIQMER